MLQVERLRVYIVLCANGRSVLAAWLAVSLWAVCLRVDVAQYLAALVMVVQKAFLL